MLLDPSSITIAGGTADGASDGTSSFQGSSVGTVNFSDGSPTTIYQSELEGITASNIILEATNYIDTSGTFFSNVVNISPNTNLTMRTRNAATDSSPTRGIDLTAASPSLEFKTSGIGTITLQTGAGASPQSANINVGKLTTAGGKVTIISSGTSVSLNSANNITQQTGATISGGSALQVRGTNVSLTESNGTSVVSGSSSTGNFEFKSPNLLTVSTVDGYAGISAASNINLVSTSSLRINQSVGSPITGQQLVIETPGPVSLQNTSNSLAVIDANLNPGGIGLGSFNLFNSGRLAVSGPIFGVTGITTKNQPVILTTGTGATTSINAAINAGTSTVSIVADQLSLGPATITGSEVSLRPFSGGRKITVGASTCAIAPCLNLVDLFKISAKARIPM